MCSAELTLGDETFAERVRLTMDTSTAFYRSISIHGGYAGKYSPDLKTHYGKSLRNVLEPREIWIQPIGTPSVGLVFLRAYRITRDELYLTAARDAAKALAWAQRRAGGWGYRADVSDFKSDSKLQPRKVDYCTFDDRTTQGVLDFLMNLDEFIDEPWLSESVQIGLDYMLKAQFPNGAWPQQYPIRGGYLNYYTFNDGAINDCIRVMLTAHQLYEKQEYLRSVTCGGDFIILSQIQSPQAGWAEQYSLDLKPAQGRVFEPPGVSSIATARNIETLVDLYLYTKNEKYLDPIPKAIDWLGKSKIGPNLWARLYEIGSNRPVYGDTDGKIHYNLDEISEDRQRDYCWQHEFGINDTIQYYREVKQAGRERYLAEKSMTPSIEPGRKINWIVSTMDKNGRWVRNNIIDIEDFVINLNILCRYLELNGPRAHDESVYSYCSWLIRKPGMSFYYAKVGMRPYEQFEMARSDEYNLPVGKPTSDRYLQNNCWVRDYTNARIVVNPTNKVQHIVIDKNRRWLDWRYKEPVTELEIAPITGKILLPIRADNSYR
jgi:hypothetical protein